MDDRPWVAMRSHNDMPTIVETFKALEEQDLPHRLLVLDNESTDGTAEIARERADRLCTIPAQRYVPGCVLNLGMTLTDGPVVAFLNSDCTPEGDQWLRRLLEPFVDPAVVAAFGRQDPRPGCPPLEAKDILEAYGEGQYHAGWRHWFSMASSAIRRSVWEAVRFDERFQYSEDVDWSWRARELGGRIEYVPVSRVLHSHGYSLRQAFVRQRGEGAAEARIFEWSGWRASLLRYTVLPYLRKVASDLHYCLEHGSLRGALRSPVLRLAEGLGRRRGFQNARHDEWRTA